MSSLSQRLRQLQIPSAAADNTQLDHLTLEELQGETVAFGQKHAGQSFEETWKDQEWIHFMLSRYQNSQKMEHRRFLKYVELKIESLEKDQPVIPRPQAGGVGRAKAKAKPVARPQVETTDISSMAGESVWDFEPEMFEPATTGTPYHPEVLAEDMNAIQQRMLNMETAVSRILVHLENQAIQSQGNVFSENA